MDGDIENEILKLLEQTKQSSMKSKAYLQYKLFNPISSKSESYNICDDTKDEHKKPNKIMNSDTLQLCYNMEDIFSNFSVLCPSYEDEGSKCCEYLLYWLYGQVNKGEYDLFNIHWLYYKFHMLLKKRTLHPHKKIKCSANFLRILSRKLLKHKKALYDFLDHYDIIKEELEANDTTEDNKIQYCKYIGYIFHLFENMLMDRNSQSIQAYRHEMKNFKDEIIDKELSFIKNSCGADSQESIFGIDEKALHTLINEQLKDVKKTDVSFRNKHLVNYDIFWDLDSYQKYETHALKEKNDYSDASENYCKPEKTNTGEDYDTIKDLCKLFISYFLYLSFDNVQNDPGGRRHLGYLNYWLNKELKKKKISATDFIDVINALLDNKFYAIDNYNKFKYIVHNIDEEVIEELDLLRKLQDYYNKIITESRDKGKCSEYDKHFREHLEKGIRKYHETKNKNFYIELEKLWYRYNKIDDPKFCKNNILPEPPEIETLHQIEKAASLSETITSCKNYTNIAVFMANSEFPAKDKCLFSFTGNLSEWKDEKLLHDYFKNYEKIRNCGTSTNRNDCKSYCDYFNRISELYSSHINKCCSCYSYPERVCSELCPKYFKCDMGYFPSDLLYNIGCKVKEEKEKEEEEGKEEDEKSYETAEDVFRNVTVDLDVIKRSHIEKPCKGLICDAFDTFAFSSFLFLGIFFSLFVFYKKANEKKGDRTKCSEKKSPSSKSQQITTQPWKTPK
ncbi:Plasmodium vivax Vir protein, putative [Plasmodium vivax]|uniref:Vir protein, putative n=1 Tax=Plasmodium vivax TaxID=5855 RepID=A0A1G4GVT9_PLAVI|nr:Plasmodium vivax Vir protein, putative [Plasmodium vivax]